VADFVKGKSTDNPKFLKSQTADPEKQVSPETRKLRGLSCGKSGNAVKTNNADKAVTPPRSLLETIKSMIGWGAKA
jgi:hypothetical protein